MILLRIAALNVFRYRRRSMLTAFAVTMSVLIMVLVRGVVNGSETMVLDQMILGQLGAIQVHKTGFTDNVSQPPLSFAFTSDAALMEKIRQTRGVVDATARITFPTMASVGDKTVVSMAVGIDPAHEYVVNPLKQADVTTGKPVSNEGAVFSPQLRRQLTLQEATEVTLLSPDFEGVMNAALVKANGFTADIPLLTTAKKLAFVPLAVAQDVLRIPGQATEIAVRLNDGADVDSVRSQLQTALGSAFEVHTWRDRSAMILDSMAQRRVILSWVTLIFLLIALIGVVNTMLMSVLSRTREIGTMMAVGMRRRQIIVLFVVEATVIGIVGSVLGVLLGQALLSLVYARGGVAITAPGQVTPLMLRPFAEWSWALIIAGIVGLGSGAASLYPAFRAARLKPVEALGAL